MEPALVTQLVKFDFTTLPAGYQCASHLHHFFQFDTILAGQVDVLLEARKTLRARAGDGVLIPPLVRHGYQAEQSYRQGSFKFHIAPRFWPMFGRSARRVRLPRALLETVKTTGRRSRDKAPLAEQQAVAAITSCLIHALDIDTGPSASEPTDSLRRSLWPLLEQIESNPHAGWTVSALAKRCHLSVDHFSRHFHRILRRTPSQHLFEARMRAAAAALLADPPLPIKEISERANYATVHSFSRAFKQMFGISPAAYRERTPQL